jgi:phosphoglycolate phosphatase-like HAD superfamily hydrolase
VVEDRTIEIIRPGGLPRRIRAVLFDWDGTLSLLREGWSQIMTRQMIAILNDAGSRQSPQDREAAVASIVVDLNGRPTIVQMQAFAKLVRESCGRTVDPTECLADYQDRLAALTRGRYRAIESGAVVRSAWAVSGAQAFLERLREIYPIIVVSGTALDQVRREDGLLGLTPLVNEWRAPNGDDPAFSKGQVIDSLLAERGIDGSALLAFGDGVVETAEVKRVGGVAVAVASHEPPRRGVNPAKREQLIRAGADAIIGDYEQFASWMPCLMALE